MAARKRFYVKSEAGPHMLGWEIGDRDSDRWDFVASVIDKRKDAVIMCRALNEYYGKRASK